MNHKEIETAVINNRAHVPVKTSGYAISLCSIISLSFMVYFSKSITIEKPIILFWGAFFCLFNFKSTKPVTSVQKILLIYLILTSFNQLSTNTVRFAIGQASIVLPVNLAPLLFLLAGFFLSKAGRFYPLIGTKDKPLFIGWCIGFGAIVLHMLFLIPVLMKFYGYGYEHNLNVFAVMCLYFSLFIVLSGQLENIHFRQITAAVFVILYLCMFAFNGWH